METETSKPRASEPTKGQLDLINVVKGHIAHLGSSTSAEHVQQRFEPTQRAVIIASKRLPQEFHRELYLGLREAYSSVQHYEQ